MTATEVYRVLGGMLALGEFSAQELALFADVPTLLVERVLDGEGATYVTTDCDGPALRYRLDIAHRAALVSRLRELETTEGTSYSTESVAADGIPAALAVAAQMLLEELPRITDLLERKRTVSLARLAWEDARRPVLGSPATGAATRTAAHQEAVSSALLLAQSELTAPRADTQIRERELERLRASFTSALHATARAGDEWLLERLSSRYLASPLFQPPGQAADPADVGTPATTKAATTGRNATGSRGTTRGSFQTLHLPTTALDGEINASIVGPDGHPADIVDNGAPITVRVAWNLTGYLVPLLAGTWNLHVVVDEVDGPHAFNEPRTPVTVQLNGDRDYREDIVLTSLPAGRAYALAAALAYRDAAGVPAPLGGYVNLGTVTVRPERKLPPSTAHPAAPRGTTSHGPHERFALASALPKQPRRFHEQFEQIQRSMPGIPLAAGPTDVNEFLYEKGVVLARDGEEARLVEDTVRTHFTEATGLTADHVRRVSPETNRSGITRIQVGDPGYGDRFADRAVAHALRSMRAHEGRAGRRLISRNHVVAVSCRSGDEPVPAPLTQGTNPACAETGYNADTAVNVLVIDNGLTHDYGLAPLLAHVRGDLHGTETDTDGNLLQYTGHGTFIVGLLASVAPNTNITVRNTLNDAGAILESEFGERLFDSIDEHGWPDVISLSAGTTTGSTDGLFGVDSFMQELRAQRTLLVAAAGDNASATPFWPAAYAFLPDYAHTVLSVGALRGDGEFGACFSNYGPWVNVFAPGERLTSTVTGFDTPVPYVYQHSTYDACRFGFSYACTCQSPRHTGALSAVGTPAQPDQVMFEGYAHWSGTSFAAPVAAGMVAAHMTANKERDPRAARRQLLTTHGEYAEVRGAHVPALRPPTWRPEPIVSLHA